MREIFEEIFVDEPLDPVEAARRNTRQSLRKRFYERAAADERGEILLDHKPVKTPGRRALRAPTRALAEAIAAEWNSQLDFIDPANMPITRLANAIIDAVGDVAHAVTEEVEKYLRSDLLFYRAEGPGALVEKQSLAWDPVLAWARESFGARFMLAQGVMHVVQPPESLGTIRTAIPADPWKLGAVASITTLTGSALLALALAQGALDADVAWAAAHVDEDWQMSQWGADEAAMARRSYRRAEFDAATTVLRLA
ncbi:MAG TPA: ATP12 family protein [Pseudolabrys sp.]|nr:ATP12 family protein [Pseudolabrys sp.]